eukprot:1160616-Pelagomonas_calceolata.AAC.9
MASMSPSWPAPSSPPSSPKSSAARACIHSTGIFRFLLELMDGLTHQISGGTTYFQATQAVVLVQRTPFWTP